MIFHLLPGTFTTFGHFVVVPGVENGRLKINDPNSIERSSHLWDYSRTSGNGGNLGVFQSGVDTTKDRAAAQR